MQYLEIMLNPFFLSCCVPHPHAAVELKVVEHFTFFEKIFVRFRIHVNHRNTVHLKKINQKEVGPYNVSLCVVRLCKGDCYKSYS